MRSKKCEKPLGFQIKHGKVQVVSAELVEKCQKYVPEAKITSESEVCFGCRMKLLKLANDRLSVGQFASQVAQNIGLVFETPTTATGPLTPSAPNLEDIDEDAMDVDQDSIQSAPQSQESFSLSQAESLEGASSSQEGPLSPRDQLNIVLKTLGMPSLEKGIRRSSGDIQTKQQNAFSKLGQLFTSFFGKSIPSEKVCNCVLCIKIVEAAKEKFPFATKKEKYLMLTSMPPHMTIAKLKAEFNLSLHMARKVSGLRTKFGPFSTPPDATYGHPISAEVKSAIELFYLSDDNSRISPNAKDSILLEQPQGPKLRVSRRLMLVGLAELYRTFKNDHPEMKIGMAKFAELKPKVCKWQGTKPVHVSCTCIYHANWKFMLEGMINASLDPHPTLVEETELLKSLVGNTKEFLAYLQCSPPTEQCLLGYCDVCPSEETMDTVFQFLLADQIEFKRWESGVGAVLTTVSMDQSEFREYLLGFLENFMYHDFIYRMQKKYIRELKTDCLRPADVVMFVDFGENYKFLVADAIQSFHWNNEQATIHPFVAFVMTGGVRHFKTYFVISDELTHDANTFHVFRGRVLAQLLEDYPHVKHVSYVSDGAGSQYKNRKNVCNLVYHESDFGLTASWTFFATSHGKNECDGLSACVKRTVRLKSLRERETIVTPEEMYNVAKRVLTTEKLNFLYVKKEDVASARPYLIYRYSSAQKIPRIRKIHSLNIKKDGWIETKLYSSSGETEEFCIFSEQTPPPSLNLQNFYAVKVSSSSYQIGKLVEINYAELYGTFHMMRKVGRGGVALKWPPGTKIQDVPFVDIISGVGELIPIGENFRLQQDDLERVRQLFTE